MVTLITGDRATLLQGGQAIHVEAGPGRAQIGFVTVRRGDEISDRERSDLPLIVTGLPAGAARAARTAR